MFDFGAALGGLLGAVGDIWATNEANSAQMALMEKSYEYQKESMQNRHQWEVEDLRNAGLNPILSATNSAGGTINVGAGQAHKADLSKSFSSILSAFTNSAVGQSQIEANKKNADANYLNAEANQIKAIADRDRSTMDIIKTRREAEWLVKQTEMADKNYELQKIFNDANVSKIQQDILNSVALVNAEIKFKQETGQAALASASAAQTSAAAALESAGAQKIIADVCERTGASEIEVKKALEGKYSAETKEAMERVQTEIDKRAVFRYKHPYCFGNYAPDSPDQYIYQYGDLLKGLSPLID